MDLSYLAISKIKCLILFLLLLVYPIHAQTTVNYDQLPDYEYDLGRGVGFALAKNCSASLAMIEDVKVNPSPIYPSVDDINVKLSVIEYYRFTDDRTEGKPEIDLSYLKARKSRGIPTSDPFEWRLLVNMTKGNKAMVFYCDEGGKNSKHTFVTTDVANFEKIKQAIELTEQFRINNNNLLNYFANDFKSDNELRKSAALNFLYGRQEVFGNVGAYILVNLLNESPLSRQRGSWSARFVITSVLISNSVNTLPELRKQAFIKLVQTANGENENAIEAAEILAKIATFNPDELRPYLKSEKTGNISSNLQKSKITGDGFTREPLLKLLSEQ